MITGNQRSLSVDNIALALELTAAELQELNGCDWDDLDNAPLFDSTLIYQDGEESMRQLSGVGRSKMRRVESSPAFGGPTESDRRKEDEEAAGGDVAGPRVPPSSLPGHDEAAQHNVVSVDGDAVDRQAQQQQRRRQGDGSESFSSTSDSLAFSREDEKVGLDIDDEQAKPDVIVVDSPPPPTASILKEDAVSLSHAPKPDECPDGTDPDTYLRDLFRSARPTFQPKVRTALSLPPSFFPPVTDDDVASYATDVVAAVRENDLPSVRTFHRAGRSLSCCNRFGESLLHMACRRGYTSMVRFLLDDNSDDDDNDAAAGVSVRIRDDCGRTPLHDACWLREPNGEVVDAVIRSDPWLLLVSDKRGHTPFAYARREHWGVWRRFLYERRDWLVRDMMSSDSDVLQLFGCEEGGSI